MSVTTKQNYTDMNTMFIADMRHIIYKMLIKLLTHKFIVEEYHTALMQMHPSSERPDGTNKMFCRTIGMMLMVMLQVFGFSK